MACNKVIFGSETLIDLTADTISADKLLTGVTAHLPSGKVVTGTLFDGAPDEVTVEIDGTEYTYIKKKGNINWYGIIDEEYDPDSYRVVAEYPDGEEPDVGEYIHINMAGPPPPEWSDGDSEWYEEPPIQS